MNFHAKTTLWQHFSPFQAFVLLFQALRGQNLVTSATFFAISGFFVAFPAGAAHHSDIRGYSTKSTHPQMQRSVQMSAHTKSPSTHVLGLLISYPMEAAVSPLLELAPQLLTHRAIPHSVHPHSSLPSEKLLSALL